MPTLDLRTRTAGAIRELDIAEFFDDELPDLAATRSELAVPGARELGVAPFTLACPTGAVDAGHRRGLASSCAAATADPTVAASSSPTTRSRSS